MAAKAAVKAAKKAMASANSRNKIACVLGNQLPFPSKAMQEKELVPAESIKGIMLDKFSVKDVLLPCVEGCFYDAMAFELNVHPSHVRNIFVQQATSTLKVHEETPFLTITQEPMLNTVVVDDGAVDARVLEILWPYQDLETPWPGKIIILSATHGPRHFQHVTTKIATKVCYIHQQLEVDSKL